ncbi:MAG TPA: pyridoxamine 5'-phosphate oxidase family protein [Thermoguttaceae bacterium]|nr:pyridoxamine 5'-phosphate oxidase family protein [Thermoguttaceae bacterium]
MNPTDDPSLSAEGSDGPAEDRPGEEDVAAIIKRLVDGEPFCVLCTQGQGWPYGSLVAYAISDDLATAVFTTPRDTRKFRNLLECEHVALLIDNRSQFPDELMKIEAATATGRAVLIDGTEDFERWADLLVQRHPYLAAAVRSPSHGLFRVDIASYFHVCRLQEVRHWSPGGLA